MKIEDQYQEYKGKNFAVCDLIEAVKNRPIIEVVICHLGMCNYTTGIEDFNGAVRFMLRVSKADLNCPIILCPEGFVLDGKHRVAKALFNGIKVIKARQFKKMPNIGFEEIK